MGTSKKSKKNTIKNKLSKPYELTDDTFKSYMKENSEDNFFVLFYAPWCGHCNALKPHYNKLAKYVSDKKGVIISQIDADKYKKIASKFKIQGFPTLFMI